MSARSSLLPAVALVALALGAAHAAEVAKPRTLAFAALPDWSGLWETEAAATLRKTGRMQTPQLWAKPPYNAEWAAKSRSTNAPPDAADLPSTTKVCEPAGFPTGMEHPVPDYLYEWHLTPEQALLVLTDGGIRHIYTDGRPHPRRDDLWPTAEGDSIGRWEGETLVIDTIARKTGSVGPPLPGIADLSEQAHFTERIRRVDI
ncbi:MAG: hypothetical protein ABI859_16815, partial [Pseudomonadota bacterium]